MTSKGLKIAAGAVLALLALVAAARVAVYMVATHEYREPERAKVVDATPRQQGLVDEKAAADEKDAAKPYVEAEYRAFPGVGSRVAIWIVAQLHLLFAAFVLAVSIF